VPADDIDSIKRRNEEMQRRLQEELSKLKPTEIPPPPSAFANAIDAALSSTPLDELTPDFGVPLSTEEVPPPVTVPFVQPPTAPPEFSFEGIEETAGVNPPIPDEFGIPKSPFFAETAEPAPKPVAATPASSMVPPVEEDFFADLPSTWGAAAPVTEPAITKAEIAPEPSAPELEEVAVPPLEEEPVPMGISEAQPEPEFGWQPPFAEVTSTPEFKIPEMEFSIPEPIVEPEPIAEAEPEFVPPIAEGAPVVEEEFIVKEPVAEPVPVLREGLPRVIVALDGGRLRWGRVGIDSEEEAIELLERAIAVYRSKHPKL
jgi:hypothetical protein